MSGQAGNNERPQEGKGGFVYVVGAKGSSLVKVGFSKDPESRLMELQVGSPLKLYLEGIWRGTRADECEIHLLLKDSRSHGEWFDAGLRQVSRVITDKLGIETGLREAHLELLQLAVERLRETGMVVGVTSENGVIRIEIHGARICASCQVWTTEQTKCPACGSQIA